MTLAPIALFLQVFVHAAAASPQAEACLRSVVARDIAPVLLREVKSTTVDEKGPKSLVTVDAALFTPGPPGTEPQRTGSMSWIGIFRDDCSGGSTTCGAEGCSQLMIDGVKQVNGW